MNTPALNMVIPAIRVQSSYSYTFYYANFTDVEGDAISITCPTTTTTAILGFAWTTNSIAGGIVTLSGTIPSLNSNYNGNYAFTCEVIDPYDAPPNNYTFTL